MCVTFTNKAAKEMRERIAKRLGRDAEFSIYRTHNFPLVGTFHALGIYFLRQYLSLLPATAYDKNFVIYDEDDKIKLIRNIMASLNIEKDTAELNAKGIAGAISHAKNRGMNAGEYGGKGFGREHIIQQVFSEYERLLGAAKGLDFDDILLQWLNIMRDENIRAMIQARYQYFLVDEYQDTNQVQYQIVKHLASTSKNLCVVGDDWQGIYSWRGANIANILSFQKDYPTAVVIKLEQNYRSTQNIINAANALIHKNPQTYEKTMWTANDVGDTIEVFANSDDKQEANTVADLIKDSDEEYGAWAILYRTNSQSRIFEEAFLRRNIPYKIYGGFRFYERKEIKDLLGYLRLLANPFDAASVGRILNVPARKLGPKALSWVTGTMESKGISFEEFLHYLPALDDVPGTAKNGLIVAHALFLDFYEKRSSLSVFGLLAYIIEKIGYKEYLEATYFFEELEDKKQNVDELLNLASRFE